MTGQEFISFHLPLTASLKSLILSYENILEKDEFTSLLNYIEHLLVESTKTLSQVQPGTSRAKKLHELVDAEIAKAASVAVSCRKGCSSCCHFEVEITNEEAAVLAELVASGHPVNYLNLKEQAVRQSHDQAWLARNTSQNRCVFLGIDEACTIYDSRPVTCRRLAVTTPAQNCIDPELSPIVRNVPTVDILLSSVLHITNVRFGSFAKMLSAEIENQKNKYPQENSLSLF